MEEILKELMNNKCESIHNCSKRCYNKKCEGTCPMFFITIMQLKGMSKEEAMGAYPIYITPTENYGRNIERTNEH